MSSGHKHLECCGAGPAGGGNGGGGGVTNVVGGGGGLNLDVVSINAGGDCGLSCIAACGLSCSHWRAAGSSTGSGIAGSGISRSGGGSSNVRGSNERRSFCGLASDCSVSLSACAISSRCVILHGALAYIKAAYDSFASLRCVAKSDMARQTNIAITVILQCLCQTCNAV